MNFEALSAEGRKVKEECVTELLDFISSGFDRKLFGDGLYIFMQAAWSIRPTDIQAMLHLINGSDVTAHTEAEVFYNKTFDTLNGAIAFIGMLLQPYLLMPGPKDAVLSDVRAYIARYVANQHILERLKGLPYAKSS
jgi:hypothetical protein